MESIWLVLGKRRRRAKSVIRSEDKKLLHLEIIGINQAQKNKKENITKEKVT
jgi:hypothetical protein